MVLSHVYVVLGQSCQLGALLKLLAALGVTGTLSGPGLGPTGLYGVPPGCCAHVDPHTPSQRSVRVDTVQT